MCVEERDAPRDVSSSWREKQLMDVIRQYLLNDMNNANDAALFYNLMLNKTPAFKGGWCRDSENSKERITVLFSTNSSGTDKLLSLIIGKY
jgi:hypothetical protein